MSGNHYFYKRDNSFTSGELGDDSRYMTDKKHDHDEVGGAEDDEDEDSEFLQDIPYSSSSLDRSSIGSIPWADDAIKQNQLDWERVERMISGQEELTDEPELRNEILEWQKKFPQLLSSNEKVVTSPEKQKQSFDNLTPKIGESLDIDSIADLKLDSLSDGEDDDDGFATPTNDNQQQKPCPNGALLNRRHISAKTLSLNALKSHKQKSALVVPVNDIERDLRINSVPLTLCRKDLNYNKNGRTVETFSTDSDNRTDSYSLAFLSSTPSSRNIMPNSHKDLTAKLLIVPPSPIASNTNYTTTNANMRMPPILNDIESKRRFRGLVNNRSFVQLTQVQQAKSAAVTTSQQRSVGYGGGISGAVAATKTARQSNAWHLPLAATTMSNRFFNNRNSIILPAINLQHIGENPTLTSSGGEVVSSSNSSGASRENVAHREYHHMTPQRTYYQQQNRTRMSTTTTTTPSTGGRSISAAVHPQSHYEFNAFYLPYSASKFKVFK